MKHYRQIVIPIAAIVNLASFFLPAMQVAGWQGGLHLEYGYQFVSYQFFGLFLTAGTLLTWRWERNNKSIGNVASIVGLILLVITFWLTSAIFAYGIKVGYWMWLLSSLTIILMWLPVKAFSTQTIPEKGA